MTDERMKEIRETVRCEIESCQLGIEAWPDDTEWFKGCKAANEWFLRLLNDQA